jgi:succinyl-CoA synthetase beta subunit
MHIHEHQAKTLFNQFGIKTPEGVLISTVEQSSKACSELGGGTWVVKAQVHAGGRGKGGGVILCRSMREVESASKKLLGTQLITPQTDAKGLPINQLLIEAGQHIEQVLYLGLLIAQWIHTKFNDFIRCFTGNLFNVHSPFSGG